MFVENETTTQIVLCLLPLELECTFCFPYIRSLSNLIYIDNLSYKNIIHFDKVKSPICHMAIPFYFHVGDNFLVIVILALQDQLNWLFMKSCIHFKVILNLLYFVKSFRSSFVLLSNILQRIGCTIGVKRPCPTTCMFFNMLRNSSFNSTKLSFLFSNCF
jgi:hypothetical protein